MSKKDGEKRDSNDNKNNASNKARHQNGVTLPWRIPEMALLQKSLCNGLLVRSFGMPYKVLRNFISQYSNYDFTASPLFDYKIFMKRCFYLKLGKIIILQ